jgi:hypothetical protein
VIYADPPTTLPVDHLSLSSLRLFAQCPERWRRRYVEREYEPPSGQMILGSAAGAAENQSYAQKIETGEAFETEQVVDEFSTEWEDRISREQVDWGEHAPGELKDSGILALERYHEFVVPQVVPVSVERKFELGWPGIDWSVIGYIDIEDDAGNVRDMKMRGKRLSQRDADADLQPTLYLAARRAEGNPAPEFHFDTMIRSRTPHAEVVTTERTDDELDLLPGRIFGLAAEMAWRIENDVWSGAAPATFFCNNCTYRDCPLRLGRPR